MEQETLYIIIGSILAFLILLSIFKSLIKAAIIVIIMIILFRIGWVYSSNDLKEKLYFDNIIKPEYQESFYNQYDNYKNKREKNEVIDTKKMDEEFTKEINKKVQEYIESN